VPFLMLSMGNFLFGCLCSNVYRKQSCLPSWRWINELYGEERSLHGQGIDYWVSLRSVGYSHIVGENALCSGPHPTSSYKACTRKRRRPLTRKLFWAGCCSASMWHWMICVHNFLM
jgi:hypothetical protein